VSEASIQKLPSRKLNHQKAFDVFLQPFLYLTYNKIGKAGFAQLLQVLLPARCRISAAATAHG